MSVILERLEELEGVLTRKGWPAMSPWWRETFAEFYRSRRSRCVLRVGRRGGKSSSLSRIAALEALYGGHVVPPGDIGYVVIVSVRKDEALARLRTIKAILDALGVKYDESDSTIELPGRRTGFKVVAASVAAVSGWTSICVLGDEVSKWVDKDTGANPATEVLNALRPTMATMSNAREYLSSSPVGLEDAHAKHFTEGTNEEQLCVTAASWIANPTLTEEQCRRLAKNDERVFRREYLAIAQGSAMGAFDPDAVEAAFRRAPANFTRVGAPVISMDPSGRGTDMFTFCSAGWCIPEPDDEAVYLFDEEASDRENGLLVVKRDALGRPLVRPDFRPPEPSLLFDNFHAIDSSYRSRQAVVTVEEIVNEVSVLAGRVGARLVVSDQFEAFSLESWMKTRALTFKSYPWGATTKSSAVGRLRGYLNSERIIIAAGQHTDSLKRQLLAYEERIGTAGISYGGKDPTGSHFDLLSTLVTTMLSDQAGDLFGAPATNKRSGGIISGGGFQSTC